MTGCHQHRHGFPETAADTEQYRPEQAILGGRQHGLVDDLPAGGAHGFSGFPVAVGDCLECILGDGCHDGRSHQSEDNAGIQHGQSHRDIKDLYDQRVHDAETDEAPHHRGDGGQQLHQYLEGLAGLAGGKFGDIDRRAQ